MKRPLLLHPAVKPLAHTLCALPLLGLVAALLTQGLGANPAEALIRLPLKELLAQLDAQQFVQVHRAVLVNLRAVQRVVRGDNETADIHLKGRPETLPVSRSYLHLFREM